jgi:hypothetical protein
MTLPEFINIEIAEPTKENTMAENPYNLLLLDEAIEQIELHPETWEQGDWRCKTGMCVAGWVVTKNGDEWATDLSEDYGSDLVLVPKGTEGVLNAITAEYYTDNGVTVPEGMALIRADKRAEQLLGLEVPSAHDLFGGGNSLDEIKRMREQMARGEAPTHEYDDDDEDVCYPGCGCDDDDEDEDA